MRHALAVLLTLLLGVLAHPAAAASRVATGPGTTVDANRGRLGVDDIRHESTLRRSIVACGDDDRAEEPEDPGPSLAPASGSQPTLRCAASVAPAGEAASRIAWQLSTVGARGPPA